MKYSLVKLQKRAFWTVMQTEKAQVLPQPEVLLTEYGELVNVKPMK